MSRLNQILTNELVRTLAMGACIVNLFLAAFLCAQIGRIEAKIDAISESVVICRWKHDKHDTVAIKGGKVADKMVRAFGPSDGGECK